MRQPYSLDVADLLFLLDRRTYTSDLERQFAAIGYV